MQISWDFWTVFWLFWIVAALVSLLTWMTVWMRRENCDLGLEKRRMTKNRPNAATVKPVW